MRFREIIGETVEYWNDKNVVAKIGDFRIAVDDPEDATFVSVWTDENKRVGTLTTRRTPDTIGRSYLSVATVDLDKKYQGNGLGLAMYRALLAHLGKRWRGISAYLPDQANKKQVPRIWAKIGGHLEPGTEYIVADRGISEAKDELVLPTIEVGDEVLVGKFKNRKAIVKGFTQDDHNQPVLKTTKGDQKLFKPRISKLEEGGWDKNIGTYTPEQAKEIGDCAIVAICNITGKSWDEVWEVSKSAFDRYGLNSGDIARILRRLGYRTAGYFKMPWWESDMTVKQAEQWLRANDPDVTLLCSIRSGGLPHAIVFANGRFHNVLGSDRAKIRDCSICSKLA